MRMPIVLAATLLTATSSIAERPRAAQATAPAIKPAAPPKRCETPARLARANDGGLIRRSDRPIPVDAYQAMYRTIDNCPVPAIYRRDVDSR